MGTARFSTLELFNLQNNCFYPLWTKYSFVWTFSYLTYPEATEIISSSTCTQIWSRNYYSVSPGQWSRYRRKFLFINIDFFSSDNHHEWEEIYFSIITIFKKGRRKLLYIAVPAKTYDFSRLSVPEYFTQSVPRFFIGTCEELAEKNVKNATDWKGIAFQREWITLVSPTLSEKTWTPERKMQLNV